VARAHHTATLLGDWVLVAGGETVNDNGTTRIVGELELFFATPPDFMLQGGACPNSDSWTFCRTDDMVMRTPRMLHGAATIGAEVLLFGGRDTTGPLDTTEFFTFDSASGLLPDTTRKGPKMKEARQEMAWVSRSDRIFLLGGEGKDAAGARKALSSIEWYNPYENSFLSVSDKLGSARIDPAASFYGSDGWLLVSGGRSTSGEAIATALKMKVGDTGILEAPSEVGELRTARFGHAMVPLWNDLVLVSGGSEEDGGSYSSTAASEFFCPATDLAE
jgi:hypothetical protein